MKGFLLILFLLFSNLIVSAQTPQTEIDSLLHELQKTKNDTVKARIYRKVSHIYQQNQQPENYLIYANKGLALVTKMKWDRGLTIMNIDIGSHYNNTGNHAKAMDHYQEALKTIEGSPESEVEIYLFMAIVYEKEEDLDNAERYINKALQLTKKDNNLLYISKCYQGLGSLEVKKKNLTKATKYYNLALKNVPETSLDLKANLLSELGNIQTDYSKKRKFLLESKAIWDQIDPTYVLAASNLLDIAESNIDLLTNDSLFKVSSINLTKETLANESKDLLHRVIKISKESDITQNEMYAYGKLAELYGITKMYDSAYHYLAENNRLYLSIFSQENKNKIAAIESQKEIAIRDKEIQLNKLTLETKEKQKWLYIGGIFLLVIIGTLLFYQSRNRQKTNEKLKLLNSELDLANKVKTRFFSILNHDLRSPVANLIHFLHLQKENPELMDEATKNRMQNKTISGAENLLSSMEDILLWSKGQMENFKPEPKKTTVHQLFEDNKKVFSSYHNITFDYQNPDDVELFTDENYLKTIIRNLTSNAINVFTTTQNPTIIWKAWQENGKSYLSISDNGPGASQEQFKALYDDKEVVGIKSGLGLHLIRDLAKAIDCEILVDSKLGEGTTFTLKI